MEKPGGEKENLKYTLMEIGIFPASAVQVLKIMLERPGD